MVVPGLVPAQKEPWLPGDAPLLPAVCVLASGRADETPGTQCQNVKPVHCFSADPCLLPAGPGLARNQPWEGGQLPGAGHERGRRCWLLDRDTSNPLSASRHPPWAGSPYARELRDASLSCLAEDCFPPSSVGSRTPLHRSRG